MKMNSHLPRGKFEVRNQLGKGAFGTVVLAKNKLLDRIEAVKEIYLKDPKLFPDALEEAKALQRLKHRNIVEIYDADFLKRRRGIYISMEFLKKGSIANIGFVSMVKLKKIFLDVLSGLEHAHKFDYIHRDIKPGNILIADDDTAKLSDFGLATYLNAIGVAEPSGYMYINHLAPEVFEGKGCSVLSDIYAVGVTMHRIINGDPIDTKMKFNQLKEVILNGKFPCRKLYRPDTPPAMVKLINKALEIEPEKRFNSAKVLADNLRKIKISCEWIRKDDNTCIEWRGRTNDRLINVMCSTSGNIVTRQKLLGRNSFRRITRLCYSGLREPEREATLRKILIGFEYDRYS